MTKRRTNYQGQTVKKFEIQKKISLSTNFDAKAQTFFNPHPVIHKHTQCSTNNLTSADAFGRLQGFQSMSFHTDLRNHADSHYESVDDQFDAFINLYLTTLEKTPEASQENRVVTLIARSPESPVAKAMLRHTEKLNREDITFRVIFACLSLTETIAQWLDRGSALSAEKGTQYMRWARNPNLLDAHEQLILGKTMSWSGDAMRRCPERRATIDVFEKNCPGTTRLGLLAFNALWEASTAIPERQLRQRIAALECQPGFKPLTSETAGELWPPRFSQWMPTRH